MPTVIRRFLSGGAAVVVLCATAREASAQTPTALPEISVETAKHKSSPPRKRRPVSKPKPAIRPEPQTATAEAAAAVGALVVDPSAYASTTSVASDQLRGAPVSTLGDALFSAPGVTSSSFAPGGASRPIIGGMDNFRVRIQENGVGSGDVSALGEDHGVPIDPLAAEKIEVIRGPETLRYGGRAVAGVVEATNNRIPSDLPPSPGFSVETRAGYTSVNRGLDEATLIDASAGGVALHGDFFARSSSDYAVPGGHQANTALTANGQSLGASLIGRDAYAGLALVHFASLYHVPGIEAAATDTRIDMEQYKLMGKGEAWIKNEDLPLSAVRFWFGASTYRHHEIGTGEDGADGVQATYKDKTQEVRVEVDGRSLSTALGLLKGTLGASLVHNEIGTSGDAGNLLAPAETAGAAGYLFEELKLGGGLSLQGAARVESVSVNGSAAAFPPNFLPPPDQVSLSPESLVFTPKSASLGVRQELLLNFMLFGNARYVERAPEASELFSKGAHDAPKTFEIGDPNLTPETARTLEIGLKRSVGGLRLDASVYYTQYAGFIYKHFTGVKCGVEFAACGLPGGELDQIVYAQRDALFSGAQAAAQYDLAKIGDGTFGVEGQYDFVRAAFADGGAVPRIPPHRLGGGMYWRDNNWFARVSMLHAFDQNDISFNETPTDGYNLLRAELRYMFKFAPNAMGVREAALSLTGDNLMNDVVRNSAALRKDEVQEPGRSVRLVGSLKF